MLPHLWVTEPQGAVTVSPVAACGHPVVEITHGDAELLRYSARQAVVVETAGWVGVEFREELGGAPVYRSHPGASNYSAGSGEAEVVAGGRGVVAGAEVLHVQVEAGCVGLVWGAGGDHGDVTGAAGGGGLGPVPLVFVPAEVGSHHQGHAEQDGKDGADDGDHDPVPVSDGLHQVVGGAARAGLGVDWRRLLEDLDDVGHEAGAARQTYSQHCDVVIPAVQRELEVRTVALLLPVQPVQLGEELRLRPGVQQVGEGGGEDELEGGDGVVGVRPGGSEDSAVVRPHGEVRNSARSSLRDPAGLSEVEDGAGDLAGESEGGDEAVGGRAGGGAAARARPAQDLAGGESEGVRVSLDGDGQLVPPVSRVGGQQGRVDPVVRCQVGLGQAIILHQHRQQEVDSAVTVLHLHLQLHRGVHHGDRGELHAGEHSDLLPLLHWRRPNIDSHNAIKVTSSWFWWHCHNVLADTWSWSILWPFDGVPPLCPKLTCLQIKT